MLSTKREKMYFEAMFTHAAIGILLCDKNGTIIAGNPFCEQLFGYDNEELTGQNITVLIPGRFHQTHSEHHRHYFENPQVKPMATGRATFAVKKDGTEFPAEISLAFFTQDKKDIAIAYIADSTLNKKKEEKIQQSEQQIRLLIEHSPAAIAMFDNQMRYIIVSKRWMKDYRLGERDITGLSHYEVFPEIDDKWKAIHQRCLAGEEMGCDEEPFQRTDGKTDWIKWLACPWYVSTGKIGGLILFTEVITRRKEEQLQLQHLNENLEKRVNEKTRELSDSLEKEKQLNELKSRFLTMASHEFRTPLSTILSSAYLIEKYKSTDEQQKREKHLQRIISAVNILTDTLDDFLSVGKIEEGKIHTRWLEFNIRDHISAIIQDIENNLKSGQKIFYDHTGSEKVYLDMNLLRHIIMNLLSNAIKFSPEDSAIRISTVNTHERFTVTVTDQGIGISKDDQQHLTERFFRGSNVTNIQGTGLGLHIVAKYAETLNGRVSCESELNKGSKFTVDFFRKDY